VFLISFELLFDQEFIGAYDFFFRSSKRFRKIAFENYL